MRNVSILQLTVLIAVLLSVIPVSASAYEFHLNDRLIINDGAKECKTFWPGENFLEYKIPSGWKEVIKIKNAYKRLYITEKDFAVKACESKGMKFIQTTNHSNAQLETYVNVYLFENQKECFLFISDDKVNPFLDKEYSQIIKNGWKDLIPANENIEYAAEKFCYEKLDYKYTGEMNFLVLSANLYAFGIHLYIYGLSGLIVFGIIFYFLGRKPNKALTENRNTGIAANCAEKAEAEQTGLPEGQVNTNGGSILSNEEKNHDKAKLEKNTSYFLPRKKTENKIFCDEEKSVSLYLHSSQSAGKSSSLEVNNVDKADIEDESLSQEAEDDKTSVDKGNPENNQANDDKIEKFDNNNTDKGNPEQ